MRYLQSAKYKKYSGTWYAGNFGAVVGRPDAVTFDASPTTFSNIELAPGWIRKWLPQARTVRAQCMHSACTVDAQSMHAARTLRARTAGQAPDHAEGPGAAHVLALANGQDVA